MPETVAELESRPEADNLVGIFAALADKTREAVLAEFGGKSFSVFKDVLAALAIASLGPMADEMRRLMQDPAEIDRILRRGAERAQAMAAPHLREIQDLVGFLRP